MDDADTGDTGHPVAAQLRSILLAAVACGLGICAGWPWWVVSLFVGLCLNTYWLARDDT